MRLTMAHIHIDIVHVHSSPVLPVSHIHVLRLAVAAVHVDVDPVLHGRGIGVGHVGMALGVDGGSAAAAALTWGACGWPRKGGAGGHGRGHHEGEEGTVRQTKRWEECPLLQLCGCVPSVLSGPSLVYTCSYRVKREVRPSTDTVLSDSRPLLT